MSEEEIARMAVGSITNFDESPEGENIISEFTEMMKKRRDLLENKASIMQNFIKSEEFESFVMSNKDLNNKIGNEDALLFIENNFGEELTNSLIEISDNNSELTIIIHRYCQKALSSLLGSISVHLFLDMLKEISIKKNGDFMGIFFDRLEAMCRNLTDRLMSNVKDTLNEDNSEKNGSTIH